MSDYIKRGTWENVEIAYDEQVDVASMQCSECKRWSNCVFFYGNPTDFVNYCPFCGAKMTKKLEAKAWLVWDTRNEDWFTVVFAETSGKAKKLAQNTDALEGIGFTDIRAKRLPKLDHCYTGAPEIEWTIDSEKADEINRVVCEAMCWEHSEEE